MAQIERQRFCKSCGKNTLHARSALGLGWGLFSPPALPRLRLQDLSLTSHARSNVMLTYRMPLLLSLILLHPGLTRAADPPSPPSGPDWVLSFAQQCQQDAIWQGKRKIFGPLARGRTLRNMVSLDECEREHKAQTARLTQRLSELAQGWQGGAPATMDTELYTSGIYVHQGYAYSDVELSVMVPEKTVAPHLITKPVYTLRIDQHLNATMLRGRMWGVKVSPHDNAIVELPPGDPALSHADESKVQLLLQYAGTQQYTTVLGVTMTVPFYRGVSAPGPLRIVGPIDPPLATVEDIARTIYVRGLANDLAAGWIAPEPNCPVCKGTGWIPCRICSGQGHFMVKSPGNRRGRKLACPVECHGGRLVCPRCILQEKPPYRQEVKDAYLKRWSDYEKNPTRRRRPPTRTRPQTPPTDRGQEL